MKVPEPALDESHFSARAKVDAILKHHSSLDSAQELLGHDIVSNVGGETRRVRITKTRSFDGVGNRSSNMEGMSQEAGHVFIMKHRSGKFLNITTGKQGDPTVVWIEEATNVATGETLKSNKLISHLGLDNADLEPIFTGSRAIVQGEKPSKIDRLSPAAEGASPNTTGIFRAVYLGKDVREELDAAVDLYTKK